LEGEACYERVSALFGGIDEAGVVQNRSACQS
jgi:hypothetical protein